MNYTYLITKLLTIPAVLLSLTIHEYTHGLTALKLGDPTAKISNRLTLNPLAHIDPLGAILMLLVGFGWAKPVPVNPRNFKNPRQGMAITAIMGPISNLILALVSVFVFILLYKLRTWLLLVDRLSTFGIHFFEYLLSFLYILHILNLSFFLFNLIPFPPLDGSRVIGMLIPTKCYLALLRRERTISYIFFFWLLFGSYVAEYMLSIPFIQSSPFLTTIFGFLSISGWLSRGVEFLSYAMFRLFGLIPFLSI